MKTILFIAALVVVGGYTWLVFWLGKKAGPTINKLRRIGINPKRYTDLEQLVLDLAHAKDNALELGSAVLMPGPLEERTNVLAREIRRDRDAVLAGQRR